MGIPKFFRWLTRRYPMILQNVQQEEDCPPSDNLYLDLNSIVHNCIHGNDPKRHERISRLADFEEVWADIMRAIDEIVHMVKPRKLILLAVDGVAPRAKMNQQRARRFRSAKDSQDLRDALLAAGKEVPELFDSNQISPGTKFMHELGVQLEWFVKFKLNTDPIYQNCERVVLSDSSVPGEGEHKMMDYIRNLKVSPGYNPNTRHCFYGSDADLIMLSLLTHEPHFMIIREEHIIRKTKQGGVQRIDIARTANLQLIHISMLREYIMLEYKPIGPQMKMKYQLERIIDDFVFFCFFIGNDFLPSLSALDIGEGSLDHLINFYKKCLPQMTDYITNEGQINWDRAEPFIELLGKHEHQVFINRVKTLDAQYNDAKNLVTFDESFKGTQGHISTQDKNRIIQEQIKDKMRQKKVKKCASLFSKNKQKNYKKFSLLKKFDEDYEEEKLKNEGDQFVQYQSMKQKYKRLRATQSDKDKIAEMAGEEDEGLHSIISDIREEFFSDLNPEEIPNSDISDISESEIIQDGEDLIKLLEQKNNQDTKIDLIKAKTETAIEKNHDFMKSFVNTYKEDSNEAKRNYYEQKLKFDVGEPSGKGELRKLLYRYLEGLQWVLYYYYKGAPHWRWYYPYHYAPMISDLGSNIVRDFLNGQTQITEFKTDEHCSEDPKPYTPFQQLLCIFPVKSLRQFLPPQYLTIAEGVLKDYFPDDFEIDLNGRTLPWEAAILIPFADEQLFIDSEASLFEAGMQLDKVEWSRNNTSFKYPSYYYDHAMAKNNTNPPRKLESLLTRMDALPYDYTRQEYHDDYEKCGTFAFNSPLLEGVTIPMGDYPSLQWLGVQELDYTEKFINKVAFKQCLALIPQTKEDASGADFEDWIYKFAEGKNKELYVKFPYQIEAFPLFFEDPFSVYQMTGNASTNQFSVTKHRQTKSKEEFDMFCRRTQVNHGGDKGIQLGENFNCLVTLSTVIGTEYDDIHDCIYKVYGEETMTVPFNLVMRKRSANHYLNINERVATKIGRIKTNKQGICFNPGLLGVMGKIKGKDMKKDLCKVEFNVEQEESKVHHPFFSENFLRREFKSEGVIDGRPKTESKQPEEGSSLIEPEEAKVVEQKKQNRSSKNFYGDQEVEQMLKLPKGFVNRLTGSFLIAFDEPGKEDRQVVDCGLNIKNFTKKVHIPDYVRFVAQNNAANNIYDEFQHNQHARGAKHIRKHWEYSSECLQIIKDYTTKFPEIVQAIQKCAKKNRAMNNLSDVYMHDKKQEAEKLQAITNMRALLSWIEKLPVSKLPYVEMGFDSLDSELINKLAQHNDYVKANYGSINLNVKPVEQLHLSCLYQESYPYWAGYKSIKSTVNDFRVGNRIMNLNSTLRQYIPFGARGIVVGKTDSKLIVMFDEQYLHGTTIYGHCQLYRGAQVEPNFMLNLSREFARLTKEDYQSVKKFQEKPLEGRASFEDENNDNSDVNHREIHLTKKFSSSQSNPEVISEQTQRIKPEKKPDPKPQDGRRQDKPKAEKVEQPPKQHQSQRNRPRAENVQEEEKKTSQSGTPGMVYKAKPFVPKDLQKDFPQSSQPLIPQSEQPQVPQTELPSSEATGQGQPMKLQMGLPSDGKLFGALPGLNLRVDLDPKLMNKPQFQKIGQMQEQPEDSKEDKDASNKKD